MPCTDGTILIVPAEPQLSLERNNAITLLLEILAPDIKHASFKESILNIPSPNCFKMQEYIAKFCKPPLELHAWICLITSPQG